MSELPEYLLERARKELREDETRKKQSIEQLRQWSKKHPFMVLKNENTLTDDLFMPYLRAKKYVMDRVFESIEKTMLFLKHHSNWSDFRGENLKRALDLYDSGHVMVLKERDAEGHRLILCRNTLDPKRFNSDDNFRLSVLLFSALNMEEETQIAGAYYINDFTKGVTMSQMALVPAKDLFAFTTQLKSTPIRLKRILVVGLPGIATSLYNLVKLALTETLRKRVQLLDNMSEVAEYVDMTLMPLENGGTLTDEEMLADYRPKLLLCADKMNEMIANVEVDFRKAGAYADQYQSELVGSFRKLEID